MKLTVLRLSPCLGAIQGRCFDLEGEPTSVKVTLQAKVSALDAFDECVAVAGDQSVPLCLETRAAVAFCSHWSEKVEPY